MKYVSLFSLRTGPYRAIIYLIMAASVPLKNPPRSLKNQERRPLFALDEVPDQFKTRGVVYFGSLHMEKPVLPRGIKI